MTVHYDGGHFFGWQFQPIQRTVQGELERALSRLADQPRSVLAAGRTDRGVHATGQVATVDMPVRWSASDLQRSLNAILPRDIWIEDVHTVHPDFHPRFDAVARTYTYRIGTAPGARSPFHRGWCWALGRALPRELLDTAAAHLPGEHSFASFRKAGQPERGDRCTVARAAWTPWELGVEFTITADRYLHHMVRYLVGTMVGIARGHRPATDLPALLLGQPRLETSPPAPPEGLFLTLVEYPDSAANRVD